MNSPYKFIDFSWYHLGKPETKNVIAYPDCEHCKGTGKITITTNNYVRVKRNRKWVNENYPIVSEHSCVHCEFRYGLRSAILCNMEILFEKISSISHIGRKRMTQEQFLNEPEGYELMKEYLALLKRWWNPEPEPGFIFVK
jgi:arginyl-tRNA--protein-N-Asp/Glu arginylyltransferase